MAELIYFPRTISSTNARLDEIAQRIPKLLVQLESNHQHLNLMIESCSDSKVKRLLVEQSAVVGDLIEIARSQTERLVQLAR